LRTRIFGIERQGQKFLGFDTGLDEQAFAQAKMAQFITRKGFVVFPGGKIDPWKAGGVIEYPEENAGPGEAGEAREKSMVIYGPDFPGERLDRIIAQSGRRQDEALELLAFWIRAWKALESAEGPESLPEPWPAAALVIPSSPKNAAYPRGTVFFAPEPLVKRCLEAEGPSAWLNGTARYAHPDLPPREAAVYCAGTMLYHVFSGLPPFPGDDIDRVRQDMREGVFIPLRFAAPGLKAGIAAPITGALAPSAREAGESRPREISALEKALEAEAGEKPDYSACFIPLSDGEIAELQAEKEQFQRKSGFQVKTRRFFTRNILALGGSLLAALILGLIISSVIRNKAAQPTTRGMNPRVVTGTYYRAMGELDHTMMDACVIRGAGKGDIEMAVNLFVTSRVRQAYEPGMSTGVIPAQEWLRAGSPPVEGIVFGPSEPDIETLDGDESDGELSYRCSYRLYLPAAYIPDREGEPAPETQGPKSLSITDTVRLIRHKDAWRIREINRETEEGTGN
jgi:hypothetical protein